MDKTNVLTDKVNLYRVGDLVKVLWPFLGEEAGVTAYVYETYQLGYPPHESYGVSLITENGCNLGGFSSVEQKMYLEPAGHTDFQYEFRSVSFLADDWRRGKFREAFTIA